MAVAVGLERLYQQDFYLRGAAGQRPPFAGEIDATAFPSRPGPDQVREAQVNIANLSTEVQQAQSERARLLTHLADLDAKLARDSDSVDGRALAAELVELDLEWASAGGNFPEVRERRRAELREQLELTPSRQRAVLELAAAHQQGLADDARGRFQAEQARLLVLQESARQYAILELEGAAMRVFWSTPTEGDMRALALAGVDVRRIPRSQR